MNLSFLWPYAGDVPLVMLLVALLAPVLSHRLLCVVLAASLAMLAYWLCGDFPFSWLPLERASLSDAEMQNMKIARWFAWSVFGILSLSLGSLVLDFEASARFRTWVLWLQVAGILGVLAASDGFVMMMWLGWVMLAAFLLLPPMRRRYLYAVWLVLLLLSFSLWMAAYATIQGSFLLQPLDLDIAWLFPFFPLDSYASLSVGIAALVIFTVVVFYCMARHAQNFLERAVMFAAPMIVPMYWMMVWLPGMVLWFYVGMFFCGLGMVRALLADTVQAQARHVMLMMFGVFSAAVGVGSPLALSGAVVYGSVMCVAVTLPFWPKNAFGGELASSEELAGMQRIGQWSVFLLLMGFPLFPSFEGIMRVFAAADQGGWEGVWLVLLIMQVALMLVVSRLFMLGEGNLSFAPSVLRAKAVAVCMVLVMLGLLMWVMNRGVMPFPIEFSPYGFGRVRMMLELLGGVWIAMRMMRGVMGKGGARG